MKLFVTGAAGFIGSNYVRHVIEHTDDTVVGYDALTYAGNRSTMQDLDPDRFAFVHGDICDREPVTAAMAGCDAVVHFAAESHVDRSIMGPDEFVRTNCLGSNIVMEIPVGPCQTGLTASATYLPTAGDIDHSLQDPSGKEVDSSGGFIPGEEGDVSASGDPYLAEGVWTFTIEMFAAGPSSYDATITFS